ncbi:MAG TPA: SDR family oxidoreductase, partial [Tianweitania sediminis]|nr:SDR family oxidoreductase [Tianweitania sediminis]
MASRTILIAGGAGGMGLATALRFAADGDCIVLADLPGQRLEKAGERVAQTGARVQTIPLDITVVEQCSQVVKDAAAFGNGIDVLINAAGVWLEGPSQDVEEQDWDHVLDVNLKGAFFLTAA